MATSSLPQPSSSSSSSSTLIPPLLRLINDPSSSTLIKQGAEAKVYKSHLCPTPPTITLPSTSSSSSTSSYSTQPLLPQPPTLIKYRFPKTYRHPSLTASLTASRTIAEVRALVRCTRGGVNVPRVKLVDEKIGVVGMEWIEGKSVRELLGGGDEGDEIAEVQGGGGGGLGPADPEEEEVWSSEDQIALMSLIARQLALMHAADVIHGDLTTSNMMVRKSESSTTTTSLLSGNLSQCELLLIDFGLSHTSPSAEDKAVDLYVLERAFNSTHPHSGHLFQKVLIEYALQVEDIWQSGAWGMGGGGGGSGGLSGEHDAVSNKKGKKGNESQGTSTKPPVGSRSKENPWKDISRKLDDVRARGRKRSMVG